MMIVSDKLRALYHKKLMKHEFNGAVKLTTIWEIFLESLDEVTI